jgi:RNA polymerase sigma factor (TIGR02999 family)
MNVTPPDITRILDRIGSGDAAAPEELLLVVYAELRRMAAAKMAREAPGHTLQATALVHEAWLRLHASGPTEDAATSGAPARWANRAHFFGAAAEAMRRILIESARRKRVRHGSGRQQVDLLDVEIATATPGDEILALDEALEKLAALDPEKVELVKLRYFIGLTTEEAAEILGISERTAKRYWAHARAWLYREIKRNGSPLAGGDPRV